MKTETIRNTCCMKAAAGTFVLAAYMLVCGCRMVSGVGSATDAIEKSTADLQTISQTITNTVPALEEANRILQEAALAIATITPNIETAKVAIAEARLVVEQSADSLAAADRAIQESERAVEASTRSIREITVAVDEGTVAINRLCQTLDAFQGGLDRLLARKGLLVTAIIGCGLLILVPPLVVLVLLGRLGRRVAKIGERLMEIENRRASGSREGGHP
jgi:hypothetical protein